ncbi:MAG: cytidine deaminase [Planctomycetota bacterium]
MQSPDPDLEARALDRARTVRENAHAPYSNFRVGAAVVLGDGAIFTGCNVESASYGLTLCAERAALAAAVAAVGSPDVVLVAIATGAEAPTPPCGACRQWIAEFAGGSTVVSTSGSGEVARWSARELLPEPFLGRSLGERTP